MDAASHWGKRGCETIGHLASTARKQRWWMLVLGSLSPFIHSRPLPPGRSCRYSAWVFPLRLNLLGNSFQHLPWGVILSPVRLTVKIYHHNPPVLFLLHKSLRRFWHLQISVLPLRPDRQCLQEFLLRFWEGLCWICRLITGALTLSYIVFHTINMEYVCICSDFL